MDRFLFRHGGAGGRAVQSRGGGLSRSSKCPRLTSAKALPWSGPGLSHQAHSKPGRRARTTPTPLLVESASFQTPVASCPLLVVSALGPGCNSRVSDGPGDDCLVCFSRQRLGRRRLLELQNRPARTSTTLQTTARCRTESAAPALLLGGSRCVRRTKEGPGAKPPSEPRPGPNAPFGRCLRKFACLFVGQEASDLSGCHSLDGVPRHESQASAGSDDDAMENIPLSSSRTRSSVPNACPDWAVTGVPLSSAV